GRRHRIQHCEHFFEPRQFRLAFGTVFQVCRHRLASLLVTLVVCKQLFFRRVFHSSVPTARAAPRGSIKGFSANRHFCTARYTVFWLALVFVSNTAAISSIPHPSQCRITTAVRSGGVSVSRASFIFAASSALPASRSGDGAVSFTSFSGSASGSPSAIRCG